MLIDHRSFGVQQRVEGGVIGQQTALTRRRRALRDHSRHALSKPGRKANLALTVRRRTALEQQHVSELMHQGQFDLPRRRGPPPGRWPQQEQAVETGHSAQQTLSRAGGSGHQPGPIRDRRQPNGASKAAPMDQRRHHPVEFALTDRPHLAVQVVIKGQLKASVHTMQRSGQPAAPASTTTVGAGAP